MTKYVPEAVQDKTAQPSVDISARNLKAGYEYLASLERVMGREYVLQFVEDSLQEIDRLIRKIPESEDNKERKRLAHDLKSLSTMFGIEGVHALAEGIEICCGEDRADEALVLGRLLPEQHRSNVLVFRQNYSSSANSSQKYMA